MKVFATATIDQRPNLAEVCQGDLVSVDPHHHIHYIVISQEAYIHGRGDESFPARRYRDRESVRLFDPQTGRIHLFPLTTHCRIYPDAAIFVQPEVQ